MNRPWLAVFVLVSSVLNLANTLLKRAKAMAASSTTDIWIVLEKTNGASGTFWVALNARNCALKIGSGQTKLPGPGILSADIAAVNARIKLEFVAQLATIVGSGELRRLTTLLNIDSVGMYPIK